MSTRAAVIIGGAAITTAFILGSLLGDMEWIPNTETAKEWDLSASWALLLWGLAAIIAFFKDDKD